MGTPSSARAIKTIVFGTLAMAALPVLADNHYPHPRSYFESTADLSEPESIRIRQHLAQVESDLRAHPPRGLSPEQAQARGHRLDDLHAYWLRGEFPRNPDYPDSLVPYFIDARGVACAVGQLVIASGHRDFAEEIARTRNHAYIREIEDPRLAAWARASGLTLEECGRIQPSYSGDGTYPYVVKMAVSPGGQVWASAATACYCSAGFQIFSLSPGGEWTVPYQTPSNLATVCLDPQGRSLIGWEGRGGSGGVLWEGRTISGTSGVGSNACAWSADGSLAWVAGNSGLRQFRFSGSDLIQDIQPITGEPIRVVAASRDYLWAGSNRGAFGRLLQSADSPVQLDSAGLGTFRVTGMAGQGRDILWAGINGNHEINPDYLADSQDNMPIFSRGGLLFRHGLSGSWTVYNRANSGLPSDTILALAPADSPSVWMAVATGIFKFTPPTTVSLVHSAIGPPVTDLATDSLGRLYISTWGMGVFRIENGSLQPLGNYVSPPSNLVDGRESKTSGSRPWDLTKARRSESRSLLGRKTGPSQAEGVFVSQAADR